MNKLFKHIGKDLQSSWKVGITDKQINQSSRDFGRLNNSSVLVLVLLLLMIKPLQQHTILPQNCIWSWDALLLCVNQAWPRQKSLQPQVKVASERDAAWNAEPMGTIELFPVTLSVTWERVTGASYLLCPSSGIWALLCSYTSPLALKSERHGSSGVFAAVQKLISGSLTGHKGKFQHVTSPTCVSAHCTHDALTSSEVRASNTHRRLRTVVDVWQRADTLVHVSQPSGRWVVALLEKPQAREQVYFSQT